MIKIRRVQNECELNDGIRALTLIFIDEYPYYSTWIEKHKDQFMNGEKQIIRVEDETNLLGYIMIHFISPELVKINGIYIFEEYKGKGIATKSIIELINVLKNANVNLIYIQTRLDNNAVVHLFDKTGFKLIGTNYHEVEQKNNWVACCNINSLLVDEQEIASKIYDSFSSLTPENIQSLREKHKNGNLVLTRKRKNKGE